MRKLISSINMTLDGFCNHTAVIADDDLHQQANELLKSADTILFGRVTYQLMESGWPPILQNPTGNKPADEFAVLIDNIKKIVFSGTLKSVDWKNTELARENIKDEVLTLTRLPGKNIIVGGPSLIISSMKLDLIDEYQFCVQPIILGAGRPLFKDIEDRINLKLIRSKTFNSGVVTLIYEPIRS
jgi:dihydrofolate reductase